MTQKARPVADVSSSGWSPTPVYAEINEVTPDDGTYVEAGNSAAVFTVKLAPLAPPAVGPDQPVPVLRVRIDGPSPVLVELLQGTTLIAAQQFDAPDGFANYTLTLTRAQAARIQYAPGVDPDLRVRVSAVSASIVPNQTLPQTIPANGSVSLTFTVSGIPTNAVPTVFWIALSHGGPVGPLTLTLTDPNNTTINLIQQIPSNTGTCTATGFRVLLSAAGASGIQGVTQSSGTITGIYQPAQAYSGFTGDPNGTWTATLTNSAGNTGSITQASLGFGTAATPLIVTPTVTTSSGPSPLTVGLNATITGGTAVLVKIDWGDGSAVVWVDPGSLPQSHIYTSDGNYSAVVTAYTSNGGGSSGSAGVTVSPSQTYSTPGSYTWTAPAGVTAVTVACWGGGGGGYGGGGGGGACSTGVVSVTPGNSYAVVVGAGGGASADGGDSTFNTTSIVAKGGGGSGGASGGLGGSAGSGSGTTKYSGGDGGVAGSPNGGGGGSSAGTGSNGNTASGSTGAAAPTGGGAGGNGVASGTGAAGSAPGGGGGGHYPGVGAGGVGGDGQIVLTW